MTAQNDPYVRVYYRALRDEKFQSLSSAAWGHWIRLLVIADGMHPASAPLPRWTEDGPLSELVTAGIVDMDGTEFYRIHGLPAERAERAEQAAIGGKARASGAQRDPSGRLLPSSGIPAAASGSPATDQRPPASPIRSSPLLSEPSQTRASPATAGETDAYGVMLLVEELTGQGFSYREGSRVYDTLAGDVKNHGAKRIAEEYRAWRAAANGEPVDAAQIVFGVHNRLHPLSGSVKQTPAERKAADLEEAKRQMYADMAKGEQ